MASRLQAPITFHVDASTSYLGNGNEIEVHGARSVQVGFFTDGSGLVAGTLKLRMGDGVTVEIPVPADNLWTLDHTACSGCLPVLTIDGKAGAGTPLLTIVAV